MFFIQESNNDFLEKENIELKPIPSTNAETILISTENLDYEDEDKHDFLDKGSMELMQISSKLKENSNDAAFLISSKNFGDDDDDDDDDDINDNGEIMKNFPYIIVL